MPDTTRSIRTTAYATTIALALTIPSVTVNHASARNDTIAFSGDPAPDGNGVFADGTPFDEPFLNASGDVAFIASLQGTAGGTNDDTGIFLGTPSSVTQMAREGQPIPSAAGTFQSFDQLVLNDLGQTAFAAQLSGTAGGTTDNAGIYRSTGTTLTQMVRKGSPDPFGNGFFDRFIQLALNTSGHAVFQTEFSSSLMGSSDDGGIYYSNGTGIGAIYREGIPAPDGNGLMGDLPDDEDNIAFNNAGQVAFHSPLTNTTGGAIDNEGVYLGSTTDGLSQIARKGDNIPPLVPTITGLGDEPTINDLGQIALLAFHNPTPIPSCTASTALPISSRLRDRGTRPPTATARSSSSRQTESTAAAKSRLEWNSKIPRVDRLTTRASFLDRAAHQPRSSEKDKRFQIFNHFR